jgi:protein-L-isoaspartate O-methyltransferase
MTGLANEIRTIPRRTRTTSSVAGWESEFAAVPRELFVPDVIWLDADDGYVALRRTDDPAAWLTQVSADAPIVTQVDDGRTLPGHIGATASSSSSQPSIMADMLAAADLHAGMRVLEIGTGTGWNTALLCCRLGDSAVVTVEIDPTIAGQAVDSLYGAGFRPTVVAGEGGAGHPAAAPYDRVLATVAVVGTVPYEWIAQTRAGGLIVTPWGSAYCNGALLCLRINDDGTANGQFSGNVAFMRLRAQRTGPWPDHEFPADLANTRTTSLDGGDVYDMISFDRAAFAIGLRAPGCRLHIEDDPQDAYRHLVRLHDEDSGSRAAAVVHGSAPVTVQQQGPRALWDEIESAYRWWLTAGRPAPDRFGLTVCRDGQTVWLDDPTNILA